MWLLHRRGHESGGEAKQALAEAEEALREIQERGEAVSTIATDARNIRERNHFAEQIEELIIRRRKPLHDT